MAVQLRDGTAAADPRLDRLREFDPASRGYALAVARESGRPIRNRRHGLDVRLNQRGQGACALFSGGHEMAARPAPVDPARLSYDFLVHCYHETQRRDEFAGGEYPGASPRMGGTSMLAAAKTLRALGAFREFRWTFSLEEFCRGVAWSGPGWVGTWWWNSMWEPKADGRITELEGGRDGGHAYLAVEIDVRGTATWLDGAIRFANSWGRDWGLEGDFWLPIRLVGHLLEDDGEALFPVRRRVKPHLDLSRLPPVAETA